MNLIFFIYMLLLHLKYLLCLMFMVQTDQTPNKVFVGFKNKY